MKNLIQVGRSLLLLSQSALAALKSSPNLLKFGYFWRTVAQQAAWLAFLLTGLAALSQYRAPAQKSMTVSWSPQIQFVLERSGSSLAMKVEAYPSTISLYLSSNSSSRKNLIYKQPLPLVYSGFSFSPLAALSCLYLSTISLVELLGVLRGIQ